MRCFANLSKSNELKSYFAFQFSENFWETKKSQKDGLNCSENALPFNSCNKRRSEQELRRRNKKATAGVA